jgi:hypothetical protein
LRQLDVHILVVMVIMLLAGIMQAQLLHEHAILIAHLIVQVHKQQLLPQSTPAQHIQLMLFM